MTDRPKAGSCVQYYQDMYSKRSAEELVTIARIKRFSERVAADPAFRTEITASPERARSAAEEQGFKIDPTELRLKDLKMASLGNPAARRSLTPLATLWLDWIEDLFRFRDLMREDGYATEVDPRFNAWRRRQVERTRTELGQANAQAIVHPVVCYELSKGCSMGCWFCGVSAEKFQGYFPYSPENAALWRDVLVVMVGKFGTAAQTGFCYWATEPADNPDYLEFVRDFQRITGAVPQTTSAAPLRDLAWTRGLMDLQKSLPAAPSRFSILNLETLLKLHETFTPEELLGFELVLHNKGSVFTKNLAGRTLRLVDDEGESKANLNINPHATSIACVSGFLINMMDRSVKLISPCRSSERRPLGYRVHLEGCFSDAADLDAFISRAVESCMPSSFPLDTRAAFPEVFSYRHVEGGFAISTAYDQRTLTGGPFISRMGDMIAEGSRTGYQILETLIEDGVDFVAATATFQELYDKGLLDDEPLPA
jgi:radical SAM family RiPP maturation amino acid epimerase